MKKALQISIAQVLFTIEEDAYARLDGYLTSLRAHFASSEGGEIIKDIEGRIAEQLLDSGKAIITLPEVEAVIVSMGHADEFGDEPGAQPSAAAQTPKKLYRDLDDAMVGGVSAGLAAYTGIDAWWYRGAFIILALMSLGFGILIYGVMWFIMPEAKTAAQKLEMRGTPITVETLSESIREKVDEVQRNPKNLFQSFFRGIAAFCRQAMHVLTTKIFPFIGKAVALLAALVCFGALLGLSFVAPLILSDAGDALFGFPLSDALSMISIYLIVIGAYLTIAIPFLLVFLKAVDILRKKAVLTGTVAFTLIGIWFLAVIITGVTTFNSAQRIEAAIDNHPSYKVSVETVTLSATPQNIVLDDGLRLTLIQGATTSLSIEGSRTGLDAFRTSEENGTVTLSTEYVDDDCMFCHSGVVHATLTVPDLRSVAVKGGSRLTAEAWTTPNAFDVTIEEGARADLNLNAPALIARVTDGAHLVLTGDVASSTLETDQGARIILEGSHASARLTAKHGSRIDADSAAITTADAMVSDGASIELGMVETLNATARSGGRIRYEGEPALTESVSGGGSVSRNE
jgi:phage shock protein PspC (stress-responsive transcriptional regulator)